MNRRNRLIIPIVIITLLLVGVIPFTPKLYSLYANRNFYRLKVGETFPQLEYRDLNGNSLLANKLLAKEKLVLVFFLPSCAQCKEELAVMERIQKEQNHGFVLVGISLKSLEETKAFRNQNAFSFPILVANFRDVQRKLGIRNIPAIYVIDKNRILKYKRYGERNYEFEKVAINSIPG